MWQKHAVVFGARATTAQLYPGRDTFESRARDQESTNHSARI